MNDTINLKSKLGLNVFKESAQFPIEIKLGKEDDPRLLKALRLCPAGLYSISSDGQVELSQDGCLECGSCKIVCGDEVVSWSYPEGATGIQYRFG